MKTNKGLLNNYMQRSNKFLDSFHYIHKDIVVLLDNSSSMKKDPKIIDNAIRKISTIYELYISGEDRFSLFTFADNLNVITNLSTKNKNTYKYTKSLIEDLAVDLNLFDKDNADTTTENNTTNSNNKKHEVEQDEKKFRSNIHKVYQFLRKKSMFI